MTLCILHVLDHSIPLHSGYSFRTKAILEQQRAFGWKTFHVTSPKHSLASGIQVEEEDVESLRFYRTRSMTTLLGMLPVLNQWNVVKLLEKRLQEILSSVKPDIIHAHSPALNGQAALRVGKRHGIPVVYEVRAFWEDAAVDHGTSKEWSLRYRLTRALEMSVFKRAAAVTAICEGLRNDILDRGIAAHKVTVVPNAVDAIHFNPRRGRDPALARRLGLAGNHVIGFIGSFYAYEGLALLLEAVPKVLAVRPNVKVVLVGGGPEESTLKQIVARLDIGHAMTFVGRVPHDQVQRYYDLIDILIYPRLPMRLTELVTPLKPLEAMARQRLVLGSNVGGHRELIRPGMTGQLFEAGDPDALATKLLSMLDNAHLWPALQSKARHFVETERTWAKTVARYEPIYRRLARSTEATS